MSNLLTEIKREQARLYSCARGGVAFPVAGAVYWVSLAILGHGASERVWTLVAFAGSGVIFPFALVLAKPLRASLLEKSPLNTVLTAAMVGMLVVLWSITIPAFYAAPHLVPLTLAIGMAAHWPIVGWVYGRTALFTAHLIVRTAVALALWTLLPETRTTLLPAVIGVLYIATAGAIVLDVQRNRMRLTV